jgi:xanthine dehydrogenase accessory factor
MHEFYDDLPELIKSNEKLAVATIIEASGSTPREVAAKMVVLPDGAIRGTVGGGEFELQVIEDAKKAISTSESIMKKYSLYEEKKGGIGTSCGGNATVFIEVITRSDKLMIIGAGHIGLALYKMALEAGFSVMVVDDRPEFADSARFPAAVLVLNCPPDDKRVFKQVDLDTFIVIVTHGHGNDKLAVKSLIDSEYKYIGMIGSHRKIKKVFDELESEGIPKDKLDKVYTPIGLDINAETPAEIAVSILAEIVNVRRNGRPSDLSLKISGR